MSTEELLQQFFEANTSSTNKVSAKVSQQMLNGEGKPTYMKHDQTMKFLTDLVEFVRTQG